MSCATSTRRSYVPPVMNLLVIRAEERFTVSSGGCDINLTKGTPDIVVNDLKSDTLLAVSGMRVISGDGAYMLS